MNNFVKIYTDGACSGNQESTNLGGWGAILEAGPHQKEIYGGEKNTTNNRMEMTALLKALEALKKDGLRLRIFSDSSYLMNCFKEKWYVKWQALGWHRDKGGKNPVKNRDLWEALIPFLEKHEFEFYLVKGHVNLNHPATDREKHFKKFTNINGPAFSYDEFAHIIEMNNRADSLANKGIDELR